MIKVNELRIGNVVLYQGKQTIIESIDDIETGFNHYLNSSSRSRYLSYEDAEPIPLTPEILEKCGFEKWTNSKTYSKEFDNGNTFQIRENNVSLGGYDSCTSGHVFKSEVKYVHQLQNLYFALTCEELEINMK